MIGRCSIAGMVFTALVVASTAGAQSDYPNRPIQLGCLTAPVAWPT